MALVRNDRPQLKKDTMAGLSEPKTRFYALQADVFELYNCKELLKKTGSDDPFRVEVVYCSQSMRSKRGLVSQEGNNVAWKTERGKIRLKEPEKRDKQMEVEVSKRLDHLPDLFVYLTQGGNDKEDGKRIGYIRIDTKKLLVGNKNYAKHTPVWYDL